MGLCQIKNFCTSKETLPESSPQYGRKCSTAIQQIKDQYPEYAKSSKN
jgi:hypothetical protein